MLIRLGEAEGETGSDGGTPDLRLGLTFLISLSRLPSRDGSFRTRLPAGWQGSFSHRLIRLWRKAQKNVFVLVIILMRVHPFPFRTRKLSLSRPMVLGPQGPGRVGSRQHKDFFRSAPTCPFEARRAKWDGTSPTIRRSEESLPAGRQVGRRQHRDCK